MTRLAAGRPVQILSKTPEGLFTFHSQEFSSLLEKVENSSIPVAVISIVGKHRRGKSYLLNWIRRYLRSSEVC